MLVLTGGCVGRRSFREQVEAARAAGFQAVSLWPSAWRHAIRKDGLSLKDLRALLDDNGIVLTEIEGCRDWVPPGEVVASDPAKKGFTRGDYLEACAVLGARNVGVIYPGGPIFDRIELSDCFAAFCDEAAGYGLGVALEFVAFGGISDAATAAEIIRLADRRNGGLIVDLWHHVRGAGQGNNVLLRALPTERVFAVQFCDGPAHSSLPLVEETTFHRQMPGDGEMGVGDFLKLIREIGVQAPYGPEVWRPSFDGQDLADVARALIAATRRVEAVSRRP